MVASPHVDGSRYLRTMLSTAMIGTSAAAIAGQVRKIIGTPTSAKTTRGVSISTAKAAIARARCLATRNRLRAFALVDDGLQPFS